MENTAVAITEMEHGSESLRQVQSSQHSIQTMNVLLAEQPLLRRVIAGAGLTGADAEDILQDISVKALQVSQCWRTETECKCWLVRVTINACMTEHRRSARARRYVSLIGFRQRFRRHKRGSDVTVMAQEELDIIRQALENLEKALLLPIMLKYFCDLSSKEISLILNISPEAVRGRLYQGRLRLAKTLTQKGLNHGY